MDDLEKVSHCGVRMSSVELSIIIVNWNSKDYLQKCIASILSNTFDIKYEIIVVDSASFDGCGDMLFHLYPQVNFIQSEQNLGFARANNLGRSYARGNMLLFLNPDTEVQGQALTRLYLLHQELHRPGVVGCLLLNSDGTIQTSCVQPFPTILNQVLDSEIMQSLFPKVSLWISAKSFEGQYLPFPVEAISGACMMIKGEVFDHVEGFSADYFMYGEDLDLCYKVSTAGFINYHVPEAQIIHHGGGSTQHARSRFSNVMIRESVRRLLRKTRGSSYSFGYRLVLIVASLARLSLLALSYPVWLIMKMTGKWSTIFDKWVSILRWGLGLEKWVFNYDHHKEDDTDLNCSKEN